MRWAFKTPTAITASPAIAADGTIYVASDLVYAIHPDGTLKWAIAAAVSSPAIGADGTIYVAAGYALHALSPEGTEKWALVAPSESPLIGADGTVYTTSGVLRATNPDGTTKWTFDIGTHWGAAIADDGTIWANGVHPGTGHAELQAVTSNGTKGTAIDVGYEYTASVVAVGVDGAVCYSRRNNVGLGSIDAAGADGKAKWETALGASAKAEWASSSPAIGGDGTVYVGAVDSKLHAVSAKGTPLWTFATGGPVFSSPAIGADGTVYFGSTDGKIYAVGADGVEKWTFVTGGEIHSSAAIGADGTVYVGSDDGMLYAIGP